MFEIYYWYSEVNIDQQLVYDLAHLGGQQPAFPSNLPAEPVSSSSRFKLTPRRINSLPQF